MLSYIHTYIHTTNVLTTNEGSHSFILATYTFIHEWNELSCF